MSSIEAGHGLRSVHMTLERDFDIERMEFDSVLDYLLPTILLLMLRIRFLRAALERQALDWPSALILLFLLVDGHAIAIGELAQALDLSTSTVSTTARKLEARGFTFYSEVPGDRRIVQVSLTTAGTEAATTAVASWCAYPKKALRCWNASFPRCTLKLLTPPHSARQRALPGSPTLPAHGFACDRTAYSTVLLTPYRDRGISVNNRPIRSPFIAPTLPYLIFCRAPSLQIDPI